MRQDIRGKDALVRQTMMAAEQGDGRALYRLGLHYATGHHVRRDYVEAHKWLNLAAVKGEARAVADRADLAREMSHQEIAFAQRAAREWMARH